MEKDNTIISPELEEKIKGYLKEMMEFVDKEEKFSLIKEEKEIEPKLY